MATSHRVIVMHALCMHTAKQQSKEPSEQRREGDNRPDRPKRTKERTPKTRRSKNRRGWVRIRDINTSLNSHSPSDKTFCKVTSWPLPGRSGPFSSCYRALSGMSCKFAMLRLHFCKCIPYFDIALLQVHLTLPGIVAANGLQHFRLWFCDLSGVRRLQFHKLGVQS